MRWVQEKKCLCRKFCWMFKPNLYPWSKQKKKNLMIQFLCIKYTHTHIYIYIYIYEMGLSYTWCNSTKIISFLDHRYQKDLMVKKSLYMRWVQITPSVTLQKLYIFYTIDFKKILWATFLLSQGNFLHTPWDTFAIPPRKLPLSLAVL